MTTTYNIEMAFNFNDRIKDLCELNTKSTNKENKLMLFENIIYLTKQHIEELCKIESYYYSFAANTYLKIIELEKQLTEDKHLKDIIIDYNAIISTKNLLIKLIKVAPISLSFICDARSKIHTDEIIENEKHRQTIIANLKPLNKPMIVENISSRPRRNIPRVNYANMC